MNALLREKRKKDVAFGDYDLNNDIREHSNGKVRPGNLIFYSFVELEVIRRNSTLGVYLKFLPEDCTILFIAVHDTLAFDTNWII